MAARVRIKGSALGPAAKYRVLAALMALGAAECIALSLWPSGDQISVPALYGAAALLGIGALTALILLPRVSPIVIDGYVGVMAIAVSGVAYVSDSATGQLACAFGLCLLAVFCAQFLPFVRMVVQVVWMLALFVAVTVLSPLLPSFFYPLTVVVAVVALVWMVAQVSALLAAAAVRDPLTGALNRRGLSESAELMRAVVFRAERPITVVAIDLNDFKGYNDTHGHLAGDRLLIDVTASWKGMLRSSDILARIGGDEFILLLANTDAATAHSLLARLHESNHARWSAGVVAWERDDDLEEALRKADKALYLAKSRPRR